MTFEGVNLRNVDDLWCGGYHSIAKVNKGGKWCYYVWGLNKHGQLGLGDYEEYNYIQENEWLSGKNIVDVAACTNSTIVLTD
jgi:alpha-tubulin suppressor-like RCC1 family protein